MLSQDDNKVSLGIIMIVGGNRLWKPSLACIANISLVVILCRIVPMTAGYTDYGALYPGVAFSPIYWWRRFVFWIIETFVRRLVRVTLVRAAPIRAALVTSHSIVLNQFLHIRKGRCFPIEWRVQLELEGLVQPARAGSTSRYNPVHGSIVRKPSHRHLKHTWFKLQPIWSTQKDSL